jgi:hypothetical protein
MSHSTFSHSPNNTVPDPPPRSNLFGLLEQHLDQRNAMNSASSVILDPAAINDCSTDLAAFADQFEQTTMRRRLSHGDSLTTPYNSPALHQFHGHRGCLAVPQQTKPPRLSGLVSPLHLSAATPPCTPDQNYKTLGRHNGVHCKPSDAFSSFLPSSFVLSVDSLFISFRVFESLTLCVVSKSEFPGLVMYRLQRE